MTEKEPQRISLREQLLFYRKFIWSVFVHSAKASLVGSCNKNIAPEEVVHKSSNYGLQSSEEINRYLEQKMGLQIKVEGAENLPPEPVIFLLRHITWWDSIGLPDVLQNRFGREQAFSFLTKQEYFKYPLFGSALSKSGQIPIDRKEKGGEALREKMREAIEKIQHDVLVFVESTRMPPGYWAPGEWYTSKPVSLGKIGAPLVPVYIYATGVGRKEFQDPRKPRNRIVRNSTNTIIFGKPLEAAQIQDGALSDFIFTNIKKYELSAGQELGVFDPKKRKYLNRS
ncbi:MAG: lysophospholipid acyltransferase family protein [Patescibacteria group bacterium]|jgi:1-acyl-sn-glycerol-3-phosphate acyltransferase